MRTNSYLLRSRQIILLGCGGHVRSVADIVLKIAPEIKILFIDEQATPVETVLGFPASTQCPSEFEAHFIAVGDNAKRKSLWGRHPLERLATIIAPNAQIGRLSKIGYGVFIGSYAHIGPEAEIGNNTIINTGAIVEHEVIVGDHSHIGPKAVVSGRSRIGDNVFIGVGATVKDYVQIGSDITIGAGAVVVKDLLKPGIYVGCPAHLLTI